MRLGHSMKKKPAAQRTCGFVEFLQDEYARQLRNVKSLSTKGADKTIVREAASQLKLLSRKLRAAQSDTCHRAQPLTEDKYPAPVDIPTDAEGYTVSFSLDSQRQSEWEAAREFYENFGFVVFRDILTSHECKLSQCEVWDYLEKKYPPFDRSKRESFSVLSSETYGLAPEPAIFTRQMVRNRCNHKLVQVMRCLLRDDRILMSHDRWCFYRPTKFLNAKGKVVCMPAWKTPSNLHLDLNPWGYLQDKLSDQKLSYENLRDFSKEMNSVTQFTGPHLQGVLAFTDNRTEDGGTTLVPGFHKHFTDWVQSLGPIDQYVKHSRIDCNRLVWRGQGAGSFKFSDFDRIHTLKRRIPIRAGSLLVWDQRVVHGSQPNDSTNFRMAQFIKAFRVHRLPQERLRLRSKAVLKFVNNQWGIPITRLTQEEKAVLGLEEFISYVTTT